MFAGLPAQPRFANDVILNLASADLEKRALFAVPGTVCLLVVSQHETRTRWLASLQVN